MGKEIERIHVSFGDHQRNNMEDVVTTGQEKKLLRRRPNLNKGNKKVRVRPHRFGEGKLLYIVEKNEGV